jgi:hypothetical protein
MISLSGGEPLLHPDLDEVVRSVHARGLQPVVFTNGLLLDAERLDRLARAGLTALAIRIDSLQDPDAAATEEALNEKRAHYAALCAEAGVFLILTSCIDRSNLPHVGRLIHWARQQSPDVGQLLLILKRRLAANEPAPDAEAPDMVTLDDLLAALDRDVPDLAFAAYLGSRAEALTAKWLQAFQFMRGCNHLGCAGKRFAEALQVLHHFRSGAYLGVKPKRRNGVSLPQLACLAAVDPPLRAVLRNSLRLALRNPLNVVRRIVVQPVTLVVPPHFVDGKRDLCDACPDAMLHEGNLVPSCGLEEIREFGHLRDLT